MGRQYDPAAKMAQVAGILSNADLHERQFGEKSEMDAAKLSLSQMEFMHKQTVQLQAMAITKANYLKEMEKTSAATTLAGYLSDLDKEAPDYDKLKYAGMSKYKAGLGDPAVNRVLDEHKEYFAQRDKLEHDRDASSYSGQAKETFDNVMATHGDRGFANKMAGATALNVARSMKIVGDPNLSPAIRAKMYDDKTGKFNLDADLIAQGEVDVATKAGATAQAGAHLTELGKLDTLVKNLDEFKDPPPELKAALSNATAALAAHAAGLKPAAPAAAPGAPANPVDAAMQRYLPGRPAASAPVAAPVAPAAAAAAPAATVAPVVAPTPVQITPVPTAGPTPVPIPVATPGPTIIPTPTPMPDVVGGWKPPDK